MIDQAINKLKELLEAGMIPTGRMRNFNTIKKGAYKQIPTTECPAVSMSWDDNFEFESFFPLQCSFDISLCIWACATHDPDEASSLSSNLLMSLESDGSLTGLLPALIEIPNMEITNGPAGIRLRCVPEYQSSSVSHRAESSIYLSQIIVLLKCETIAGTRNNFS
jgi:hypothetical protein